MEDNSMSRKALAAVVLLACCLVAFTALSAGVSVTLKATDSVSRQAAAFEQYLNRLDAQQRGQWMEALQGMLRQEERASIMPFTAQEEARGVYIVTSGEVYHSTRGCSTLSRSKNVREVSLEDALSMGRRPCKVCGK